MPQCAALATDAVMVVACNLPLELHDHWNASISMSLSSNFISLVEAMQWCTSCLIAHDGCLYTYWKP